eukprot:CAMPEP_0196821484 /NCGR_PEP_ID=MMETSP1362-20130617/79375_1 /TAXON_ID=163516 /ORGANISM="Leptocylindrus danicus, Strain CCMP1856" /LENGTH=381 /DNA_ID=CAMNT_0042200679 /DNA_START=6 /DNA_END=1151 /DNA_ORIENTATION=+
MTMITTIAENTWRSKAAAHSDRIYKLLRPGLVSTDSDRTCTETNSSNNYPDRWRPIDRSNPVYNFLEEYYGVKGAKGVRRLARWSAPLPRTKRNCEDTTRTTGVLLLGANEDDICGGMLHMRGAELMTSDSKGGVKYAPRKFYTNKPKDEAALASAFVWYRNILATTLQNEPVTHCHGLHEWAMLYRPNGAPKPPSGKYQAHLALRVDQDTINAAVERRGVSCTHVDALRFFADAALPLNVEQLEREDQVRVEQPGCVHANMDLLKIATRLSPWIDASLIGDALEVALDARRLDIAASPYDVSAHGLEPVCIETKDGRKEYRRIQADIMRKADPVRRNILDAYDTFLDVTFRRDVLESAQMLLPQSNAATSNVVKERLTVN